MSVLTDRMSWRSSTYPDKREVAQYGHITQVPLMRIGIYPGVISYEDMDPLTAPDGALIAATGRGQWGQLYRAGKY